MIYPVQFQKQNMLASIL